MPTTTISLKRLSFPISLFQRAGYGGVEEGVWVKGVCVCVCVARIVETHTHTHNEIQEVSVVILCACYNTQIPHICVVYMKQYQALEIPIY